MNLEQQLNQMHVQTECHVTFADGSWIRSQVGVLVMDLEVREHFSEIIAQKFRTRYQGCYYVALECKVSK